LIGANPLNDAISQAVEKQNEAKTALQQAIENNDPQYEIDILQQIVWDFDNITFYLYDVTNCTFTSNEWDSFYDMLCTDVLYVF
jgi:hypothetical protein